ncbi:hypothetical protein FNU76_05295 [Chitinimonas arctica]|uniref:Flagellar hook-associated protein 2 C-terminal domain-containing protein n=1 Tax=Chitinimonas arctica TaxID=2594795 RepID=A0A516SCD5_9NEIS|nr:flagellar filament capping protein FliD [Chitinimonas arctica]QDQ25812.1 hypothetical protein FNU76_05295 [Chitinimonas arctica]
MSVKGISEAAFLQLNQAKRPGAAGGASLPNAADSFAVQLAQFKTQTMGALMSDKGASSVDALGGSKPAGGSDPLSALTGSRASTATTGLNPALFDPQAGYDMMSLINKKDVNYQAQFAELSEMKTHLLGMQQAGKYLGDIKTSTGDDAIKAQLQEFTTQYNRWVQRFDGDMQAGGVLAGTQAAQVSRYELEQNIKNIFYGAKSGMHGMADLGVTIDPDTKLASLDADKLASALKGNRQGVVDTVQDFSGHFVHSAELLNSDGNFILKQLANLNKAIHYIADNRTSLQAEFGSGDAAQPTGKLAEALAAYQRSYRT